VRDALNGNAREADGRSRMRGAGLPGEAWMAEPVQRRPPAQQAPSALAAEEIQGRPAASDVRGKDRSAGTTATSARTTARRAVKWTLSYPRNDSER
jgi:hypothetical protein